METGHQFPPRGRGNWSSISKEEKIVKILKIEIGFSIWNMPGRKSNKQNPNSKTLFFCSRPLTEFGSSGIWRGQWGYLLQKNGSLEACFVVFCWLKLLFGVDKMHKNNPPLKTKNVPSLRQGLGANEGDDQKN